MLLLIVVVDHTGSVVAPLLAAEVVVLLWELTAGHS
jgi:hypothetical protein